MTIDCVAYLMTYELHVLGVYVYGANNAVLYSVYLWIVLYSGFALFALLLHASCYYFRQGVLLVFSTQWATVLLVL